MERNNTEKFDQNSDIIERNYSTLQNQHSLIYKRFFNSYDIVLSAPSVLTWGADISQGMNTIKIKQKLPMKIFYGGNKNNSGKIHFGMILEYSSSENTFIYSKPEKFLGNHIESVTQFIKNFLVSFGYSGGLEIDFLSENTPGHGFSSSSSISVLITFLLYILVEKLDIQLLIKNELQGESEIFNQLYLSSLELSNIISHGNSIGASNYAIMLPNNPLPIIHYSQKSLPKDLSVDQKDLHVKTLPNQTIYKNSLLKFLGLEKNGSQELQIDYGILFTGLTYRFDEIISTRENLKNEKQVLSQFTDHLIHGLSMSNEDKMLISELLTYDQSQNFVHDINTLNIKTLQGFYNLFIDKYSSTSVDAFIDTIQRIGQVSFSHQKENKLFFEINYLFHQYKAFEDEMIGIFPFNTGKTGGSFLFVLKKGKSGKTIEKLINKLKDDGYDISLDYASWKDGYMSDGVKIEQFISKKIYSGYTKEGDLLYVDTNGYSYSQDYDTIIKNQIDGILLDTIGGRIYIRGVKLTSKEIHSQNTTIDLLKILIENLGKEVSNSKLPVSTYSQNKNELLGKIILPIKKNSKRKFWCGTFLKLFMMNYRILSQAGEKGGYKYRNY